MIVVLDTSVIVADFRLEATSSRRLLDDLREAGVGLVVPELVVLEAVNKFREQLATDVALADKSLQSIARKRGTSDHSPMGDNFVQSATSEYEGHLRRRIDSVGGVVPPIPEIPHRVLVDWALQRRKPFSSDGRQGYRDALIWLSVLDTSRKSTRSVSFLSSNVSDFGADKLTLAPALVADLEQAGLDPSKVMYFGAVDAFVTAVLEPRLEAARQSASSIARQLNAEAISAAITAALVDQEIVPEALALPEDVMDLQIQAVDSVMSYDLAPQAQLSMADPAYALRTECRCRLGGFMEKSVYRRLPVAIRPPTWGRDWDTELVSVAVDAYITFSGTVTVPSGTGALSISIEAIQAATIVPRRRR